MIFPSSSSSSPSHHSACLLHVMNQVQTNEEMATRSIMAALSVLGLEDAAKAVFQIATARKRRDWHNELIRIGFPKNVLSILSFSLCKITGMLLSSEGKAVFSFCLDYLLLYSQSIHCASIHFLNLYQKNICAVLNSTLSRCLQMFSYPPLVHDTQLMYQLLSLQLNTSSKNRLKKNVIPKLQTLSQSGVRSP